MKQLMASFFWLIWLLALQSACPEGDYYYFVVRAQTRSVKHGKSCYSKLVYRIRRLAMSNWKSQDIILNSNSKTPHCHLTHNGKEWHCDPEAKEGLVRMHAVTDESGNKPFKATLRRAEPDGSQTVVLELYDGQCKSICSRRQCVFTKKIGNQVHELKLLVPGRQRSSVPYPVTGPIDSHRQINAFLIYGNPGWKGERVTLSFPMRTSKEPLVVCHLDTCIAQGEHADRGSPMAKPAISVALTYESSGVFAVFTFVPEGRNVPDDAVVLVIPHENRRWTYNSAVQSVGVNSGDDTMTIQLSSSMCTTQMLKVSN